MATEERLVRKLQKRGSRGLELKELFDLVSDPERVENVCAGLDKLAGEARQALSDSHVARVELENDIAQAKEDADNREAALQRDIDLHVQELAASAKREQEAAKALQNLAVDLAERGKAVEDGEAALVADHKEFVERVTETSREFEGRDNDMNRRSDDLDAREAKLAADRIALEEYRIKLTAEAKVLGDRQAQIVTLVNGSPVIVAPPSHEDAPEAPA